MLSGIRPDFEFDSTSIHLMTADIFLFNPEEHTTIYPGSYICVNMIFSKIKIISDLSDIKY